jgi:hypothetical protein
MPNIEIVSSNESVIGSLRFTICHDRQELEVCHNFRNSLPSLERCLGYVGMEEEYSIAFLNEITVDENLRRNDNRYGLSLMQKFEEISAKHGCKMAACKVGWIKGVSTRDGNILFYKKCDWKLYDLPDEPVMAFKLLGDKAPMKELKPQATAKMVVFWKDENFADPFDPKPCVTEL